MVGLGIVILWLGYTAFAYGHALDIGVNSGTTNNLGFLDMVLPSHRQLAVDAIKAAQMPTPGG